MLKGNELTRFYLGTVFILLLAVGCSDSDDPGGNLGPPNGGDGEAVIADHSAVADFSAMTPGELEAIRQGFRFYYGHTSHGSQIMTGLQMLAAEDPQWASPTFHEVGDDLGHNGDVTWVPITRQYLDTHPDEIEVVMWSWCGGVSDNTETGISIYLNAMNTLEQDYPEVIFVYMTGHLDGTGENGNLRARNNQIRAYCRGNGKILFDFADIESYDPDGVYYPDETDACQWCSDWCADHECPECSSCAHSHCYNCYRKGMAFWCMMGQILAGS